MRLVKITRILAGFLLFSLAPVLYAQDIYWEDPQLFFSGSGSFPVSDHRGNVAAVAWQETSLGTDSGYIRVNLAVKQGRGQWITRPSIAEYRYSGPAEPAILSIAVDDQGRILLATAVSGGETELLISSDLGATFTRRRLELGSESSVAPRIFTRSDGGYLLFVTRGSARENLTIYYSRSDNGSTWSPFQPFITEQDRIINFLPTHVSFNGREYIVYQSRVSSAELTFQLFLKSSNDNGRTWSNSIRITNFRDPTVDGSQPDQFDNQRAHLSVQQDQLFVVWERRYRSGTPQVYGTKITTTGSLYGAPDRINVNSAYCNNPIAMELRGKTFVIWFDNSQAGRNHVMMSSQTQYGWEDAADLSREYGGEASFGRPVISNDNLIIFWQATRQNQNRIYSLAPDTSVLRPVLIARNFIPGRRSGNSSAIIGWNPPRAGASIRGYSWS